MEGEQRYEDGIAAEVCTKKEGAVAQERGEKEGGERRGGGTVAITSPENRLLVSCSCPDFDSLSLSIYLAPSFSLSLSFSLTVCAALVPRGACQISQSHTLFSSGGYTKRQCRQSDLDLCTHSWCDSNPLQEGPDVSREITRHTGNSRNSRQTAVSEKSRCINAVFPLLCSFLYYSPPLTACFVARECVCENECECVWLCESVWVCVHAAGCSTLWGRLKGSARAAPCSSSSSAWWVGLRAGCTTPSQGSVLSSLSLFVLMGELTPTAQLH